MSRRVRRAAFACILALSYTGIAACSSGDDSDTVVIDSSVTQEDPVDVELDGLSGSIFFGTADAARMESGEVTLDGKRPVLYWQLYAAEGQAPKSFHAKIELLHNGETVDAYYSFPPFKQGLILNEMILNDIEKSSISGVSPQEATQPGTYGDELASSTGSDFEFRLTDISVSDTPFAPTHPPAEPMVTVGTVRITTSERQEYCRAFARITPGMFEIQEDTEILADPGSSSAERLQALRRQSIPSLQRTHPYDCDLKSDSELFAEYVQEQEAGE